jgi:hypothetical protein
MGIMEYVVSIARRRYSCIRAHTFRQLIVMVVLQLAGTVTSEPGIEIRSLDATAGASCGCEKRNVVLSARGRPKNVVGCMSSICSCMCAGSEYRVVRTITSSPVACCHVWNSCPYEGA